MPIGDWRKPLRVVDGGVQEEREHLLRRMLLVLGVAEFGLT